MPKSLRYEIGPIRPPSEAYSLLVRFTRNCPWNRCEFCHIYKGKKFERRPLDEIKADIDTIKEIRDQILALSFEQGEGGTITEAVVERCFSETSNEYTRSVAVWLYFGGRHVFIQDANSLVMRVDEMAEALLYLKKSLLEA